MDAKDLIAQLVKILASDSTKNVDYSEPKDGDGLEVVLGGFREVSKANGEKYSNFNVYLKCDRDDIGVLIGGFRLMGGKICPPTKYNPGTKRTFNISYVSQTVANKIYDALRDRGVELGLRAQATYPLIYNEENVVKFLPETARARGAR